MNSKAKLPFRILGIDHIGLVPKDVEKAKSFMGEILALPWQGSEEVEDQQVRTFMYAARAEADTRTDLAPGGRLELLSPIADSGPIAKYLAKRGSGLHHLAMRVDHIDKAIAYLKEQGVRMIDEQARLGSHHTKVAFIHPEATGGILWELVEALP